MVFDLRRALDELRGRGQLLILPHDNPDPDSMASALGLELLAKSVGVESTLGLGGIVGRAENRAMVRELEIALHPVEQLDLARFDLVALVDTQPGTGNNSLPGGRIADVVIDHHPLRSESLAARWCDVREPAGATSTIVYGYLKELGLHLDSRLATAFLYALKSETRELSREAGPLERDAYVDLLPRADHTKLHAIVDPKVGRSHFVAVDRALRAAEVRGDLVTANLGALDYPDLVAEVADLLLPLDCAHWVLCVGQHRGTVFLSIRTDLPEAHAGALIRRLVSDHGAGGGHGMIAGGRLSRRVHSEGELTTVYEEIVQRLAVELRVAGTPSRLL